MGTMNITVGYRQYQRLVFIVPYVGSRCTKRWYPTYQTLVLPIPNIGTSHTSLWYFPYPIEVSAVLPL
ncbi:hypothetical protein [Bacteroides stercoris]|uniref:hypothetical protein n=1 Tax=Bacteroides stercoris TaxID=46506 RepID=UPI00356A30CB